VKFGISIYNLCEISGSHSSKVAKVLSLWDTTPCTLVDSSLSSLSIQSVNGQCCHHECWHLRFLLFSDVARRWLSVTDAVGPGCPETSVTTNQRYLSTPEIAMILLKTAAEAWNHADVFTITRSHENKRHHCSYQDSTLSETLVSNPRFVAEAICGPDMSLSIRNHLSHIFRTLLARNGQYWERYLWLRYPSWAGPLFNNTRTPRLPVRGRF
jgi:hypothetical protein